MIKKQAQLKPRGQALVLIVLAITTLLAFTGLAVDGGNLYMERRNMQSAADSAALAGALSRIRDGGTAWINVAFEAAANNGYDNNGETNIVKVYSPPISGPNIGDIEYIQISIDATTDAYFAGVIGMSSFKSHIEAISRTTYPTSQQLLKGLAVVSLAPTSNCTNRRAFDISGEATLQVYNGGVFVNSNNPTCALDTYGNGSIRIMDPGFDIAVVGGASIQKPQLLTPFPPTTKSVPISYPPPFILPKLACKGPATISALDPTSISPGYWDGDFPPDGVTGMQPGIYCLNDDFITTGGGTELHGYGVTIFMQHGKMKIASGTLINLEAPLSGDQSGLLLYAPMDNHNTFVLSGDSGSTYRGTILAIGGTIHLKNSEFSYGFHSQLIGYQIMADGISKYVIRYLDNQNYNAINMPQVQLVK